MGNRLTNQTAPSGYHVSFAYNATGLRTNMVDVSGTTMYLYDAMSRLTNKVTAWTNGPTMALSYGYNPDGSLLNLWSGSASGVTNAYQYDLLGRLTNVLASGGVAAGYAYDAVGNLQAQTCGNGVTNLNVYDSQNRLTNQLWKVGNTALANFAYTLGPTGNRTALVETNNGTQRSYAWAYDSLYRLTQEAFGGASSGTLGYAYDPVGNRTNRVSSIAAFTNQNFLYTANDWLTNDVYDANGNTTNSSGNTYQYDTLNHLTNANNGNILIAYDGDGNRVRKTVSGTTTYYLVDEQNPSGYVQVLEEWTANGGSTYLNRVYNYGLDLISQRIPGTSTNYFLFDGHGSTRALTDIGANVVNTFAYDAFGTLIASNTSPQTAYLYCGQQFDPDLGIYYNRARYVSQNTGRFWTMDTDEGHNEDPLSLHKYMYGEADPVDQIDPSGHESYVGFDTAGWGSDGAFYGHVGIITHNPSTGIYTEFDHAHGIVWQRKSSSLHEAFSKTDNYGIVFIIPAKYDVALDTARQNYQKHPGGSTMENNCMTSVMEIFKSANVPYPNDNDAEFPNMWLMDFWNANYGYKLLKSREAGNWLLRVLNPSYGIGVVPGTAMPYID